MIDGDTIEVQHLSDSTWVERVRLLCIDTPERGQPGYDEATQALEKLVLDEQVISELDPKHDTRDCYGRVLAYVILEKPMEEGVPDSGGSVIVNVEMVKLGHTTHYKKYGASSTFDAEFQAAE